MNDKYLAVLEFFDIIDALVGHCSFSASVDLARALRPVADEDSVAQRLAETSEAKVLLADNPGLTVGAAHDIRALARHAAIWASLDPAALLDIRTTLVSVRTVRSALLRNAEKAPRLAAKADLLDPLSEIIDEIGRCLDDEGRVLDSASPELARIRRESGLARERLVSRLRAIIASPQGQRYLQEPIVTERNRRYVIPIKIEHKGRIPGIIHDQSSSGATLFIEPLSVVDLNNAWHELQLAEAREIERILAHLSHLVGEAADTICRDVQLLAEIDLALAKARYSFALRAFPADLVVDAQALDCGDPVALARARHPLLPEETVEPIDVAFGGSDRVMLITGPNTGGKTVTLKTVGLLAAMNQAGLHIPAGEGSCLPVFHGIFADIGDEQSIAQSLSTFSSHVTHIIDILDTADERSLVLLDEVGVGTDPIEGAALAQALIEDLLRRRCIALCSSHYSRLKAFAFETPGVLNASVDFDLETLAPTYHVSLGLPGRSYALSIAQRLGLHESIVRRAQELVSPEDLQMDALLANIKEASEAADDARDQAEMRLDEIERKDARLRTDLANIESARRMVLEEAREQARQELETLRAEIARIRRGVIGTVDADRHAMEEVTADVKRLADDLAPTPPARLAPVSASRERELCIGDTVYVPELDKSGRLLSLDDGEAQVAVGPMRLRTQAQAIEFRGRDEPSPTAGDTVRRPRPASPGMNLDLRGFRAEEVQSALSQYLNDAYLASLPLVHIIHGKGGGVLKQVVREQLRGHPLVESFRPGELSEGGDGNTVVQLVESGED